MEFLLETVGQSLLDSITQSGRNGLSGRIRHATLHRLRRALLRLSDPVVRYQLDGFELELPLSHQLPVFRKSFPDYSAAVGRIAREVLAKYPDLAFIDIGANVGDTVAILRARAHFPILCIEGDPYFDELLGRNIAISLGPDVERARCMLTSRAGASETGEAGVPGRTLSEVLAGFPAFAGSKMLKCDTDGSDLAILSGELEWIAKRRPVLFFEFDPGFAEVTCEAALAFFAALFRAGYSTALVFENTGGFRCGFDPNDAGAVERLVAAYARAPGSYCDVCVFHEVDRDLRDRVLPGLSRSPAGSGG